MIAILVEGCAPKEDRVHGGFQQFNPMILPGQALNHPVLSVDEKPGGISLPFLSGLALHYIEPILLENEAVEGLGVLDDGDNDCVELVVSGVELELYGIGNVDVAGLFGG